MKLLHGDCYKLISDIPDNSLDLVITDPPYEFNAQTTGSGMFSDKNAKRYNRKRAVDMLDKLEKLDSTKFNPVELLEMLKPKMKRFYGYFFCNKTLIPDYLNWAVKNNYSYDILVMNKTNPIPAHSTHHVSDLEYIVLIRHKGGGYFKGQGLVLDDYRKFYSTNCAKRLHPAQKPVELLERFVRVSCPENGIILDPFMGSGSTAIAAIKNGCDFIGIEKNTEYFNIAKKRIDEYNGVGGLFDFSDMKNAV